MRLEVGHDREDTATQDFYPTLNKTLLHHYLKLLEQLIKQNMQKYVKICILVKQISINIWLVSRLRVPRWEGLGFVCSERF